jgi:DNA-binding CsgD family transcriptional regulator
LRLDGGRRARSPGAGETGGSPHGALCIRPHGTLRGNLPDKKALLTAREREVLSWVAAGKSAAQISQALKISKRTVDEHSQTAARKLGAANRTQAVAIAMRDRIIDI